jgi:iron complex outermembrane receptor protein
MLKFFVGGSMIALLTAAAPAMAQQAPTETPTNVDSILVTVGKPTSVGKLDVPLRDQPLNVTVITSEILRDFGNVRIEDIGYATVGLQATASAGGAVGGGFFMRGFNGAPVITDGYYSGVNAFGTTGIQSMETIESVEILRGSAALLYGQGSPGGLVNLTSKRPQRAFGAAAHAYVDEHGGRYVAGDVTGPAGDRMSYRLVGALQDGDTFRDLVSNKRVLFAPSVELTPFDNLTLRGAYTYDDFEYRMDNGPGINPDLIADMDVGTNVGEPWVAKTNVINQTIRLEADWKFAESWTLRGGFFGHTGKMPGGNEEIDPDATLFGTTVDRYVYRSPDIHKPTADDYMATVQILGRFNTGSLVHNVTGAVDYIDQRTRYAYEAYSIAPPFNQFDYAANVHQTARPAMSLDYDGQGAFKTTVEAGYVQDLISLGEAWKVLVGLRRDKIVTTGYADIDASTETGVKDESKVTPRLGVVWKPVERLTVYGSYGESFSPLIGMDRSNQPFDPEESRAYEIGARWQIGAGLLLSGAIYDITKENLLVVDPIDTNYNINAGVARSQGFELELQGRVAPNWRVGAGLSYTDARITESLDPSLPNGDKLPGSSDWMALLNTRYEITDGPFAGLTLGGNASYGGKRPYMVPNTPVGLPAYTRVDLFASYPLGDSFEVQINVNNIADERILTANGYGRVQFDQPRTALLTLRYRIGSLAK